MSYILVKSSYSYQLFENFYLLQKNCNQHKVTTNWKNDLPWHVPKKSVSFSRPDFKIFPFQFPWFQLCVSTSAPSGTENQPGESLESKTTVTTLDRVVAYDKGLLK